MKSGIFSLVLAVLLCSCSRSATPEKGTLIPLYEGAAPGSEEWTHQEGVQTAPDGTRTLFNVVSPTLEAFVPDNPCGSAVLVVPGGGFMILSYDTEGTRVAERLNENGITAFVLKYRTGPLFTESGKAATNFAEAMAAVSRDVRQAEASAEAGGADLAEGKGAYDWASRTEGISYAYEDASNALCWIRSHSKEYGIKKLGMVGFSAGAITALHQAQCHDGLSRPDFVGAVYGGWDSLFSVPSDGMPLFLCSPVDDVFLPEESIRVYKAWHQAGFPVEHHFYYKAKHGFGANSTGHSSDAWMDAMIAFMKDVDFL